jgi:hypothetical protein
MAARARAGPGTDPDPVIDFAPVIKAVVELKQELKEHIDTSDAGNESASMLVELKDELAEMRIEISNLAKKVVVVLAGKRGGNGERKRAMASSSTKKRGSASKKKKKTTTEDEVPDEVEEDDEQWLGEQEQLREPARQGKNVVQQPCTCF